MKYMWNRSGTATPFRAIGYSLVTVPLFITVPTTFAASGLVFTVVMQFVSAAKKEEYTPPPKRRSAPKDENSVSLLGACFSCKFGQWWEQKKKKDEVGQVVFLTLYTVANIIVFVYYIAIWWETISNQPGPDHFSYWVPLAKGFGSCLDLNIVMLLLPVSRTLVRWLYDHSTSDHTCTSRFLRAILTFCPLDEALDFHILVGWVTLFHAWGHTVAHLLNYINAPGITWEVYSWPVWFTGGALFVVMLFMYSAVPSNVKSGQFEIFWYAHHLFVVFFGLCLIHGKGWWGPNFWKWLILPGTIYAVERMYREYKSRQAVTLYSVTHMDPNVYCVEIGKDGALASYKEGQYVFIKCPRVSKTEWHPFTISSAPQEDTVTLHIRSQGEGSWTKDVQDYLRMMAPASQAHCMLTHVDESGHTVPGKTVGPDGQPLFRIYGPLSAPTQHLSEYSSAMIVTTGIGVTPLAASIKSIVQHRWRFFIGQSFPDHAFFYWLCSEKDLDQFRWFIRVIRNALDDMTDMCAKNPETMVSKQIGVHLFVTSAKSTEPFRRPIVEDDTAFWGLAAKQNKHIDKVRSKHSEMDIYSALKDPTVKEASFDFVHVHKGRICSAVSNVLIFYFGVCCASLAFLFYLYAWTTCLPNTLIRLLFYPHSLSLFIFRSSQVG